MPGVRRKPVPPAPENIGYVAEVRAAVPLVPAPETDCCARLIERAGVPARDRARTWLTFLAALGLARETDRGWVRTRDPVDPDRETLAAAFREGVFGVRELLDAIGAAEGGLTADGAFEAVRGHVPRWERDRNPQTWASVWRERVERLLAWVVLLGLVERVGAEAGDDADAPPAARYVLAAGGDTA